MGLAPAPVGAATHGYSIVCPAGGQGQQLRRFTLTSNVGAECHAGNDTNTVTSSYEMFGVAGWILQDKSDDGNGANEIHFLYPPQVAGPGSSFAGGSGNWQIDGFANYPRVAITLMTSNAFAAFLLDTSAGEPIHGTWMIENWNANQERWELGSLSHASIYSQIPLPAAGWLLIGGLGGLGAISRRRNKQAA